MTRLETAIHLIGLSRDYTTHLLDQTKEEHWFVQPPGGVTHIGWQVGHLADAEFRLALDRVRGSTPEDAELVPADFGRLFARESVPDPDPSKNPIQSAIRAVFDRVHHRVLQELPGLRADELDDTIVRPHPIARTKLLSLLWCAQHEMVQAGQIGLLRRQLGYPPLW